MREKTRKKKNKILFLNIKRKDNEIMKKVKSIFKKALAMMGENEVKAWGIGIK